MLRNRKIIGTILITVGLLGTGASLVVIACLTQQILLLASGSLVLLGDGVYILKRYYFLR